MEDILLKAKKEDNSLANEVGVNLQHPKLNTDKYYLNVASDPYFKFLSIFRHHIHAISNSYFSDVVKARHMDLFLMTSSISSPSGSGERYPFLCTQFLKYYHLETNYGKTRI